MENQNMDHLPVSGRAGAKDFFLHLGAIVALYTVTISFLNLVFKVINKAFPEIARNYYGWGGGSEISMPVATLIVVFPLFIILSRFVYKTYEQNPEKKELSVRKWLTYITLFVAGIILAADLITVLYRFLDGQDLTAAFLLKAFAVLLVAGAIFGYYLQDIRDKVSARGRKMWTIGVGIVILISIILGFSVLGSPRTQQLIRYDNQKISNLQSLQYEVIRQWQTYGVLPDSLTNNYYAKDPQTGEPYEYRKTSEMTFELCANFNRETEEENPYSIMREVSYPTKFGAPQNENWSHGAGRECFERVIDPAVYPTQIRG